MAILFRAGDVDVPLPALRLLNLNATADRFSFR
jgi:hypothetical protein